MNLHVLNRTCEYVQSYERKGSVMVLSVRTDKLSEHEANIRFERKMGGFRSDRCVCAHAPDSSPPDEPVEVCDCGGLRSGRRQE